MSILELRTEKERTLFTISLVISCLFWGGLVLGTLGIGLLYLAAGAGVMLVTQALFLAALKSNGVRITAEQLPELYARIESAAKRLQLSEVPEAYLLNERGLFNAFATRFLGRDFVVLYTELLEACDEKDGSIDFIIGHELGHLALGHLKYAPVLFPARLVPLLGPAYARACEYSCDRAGTVAAQRPDAAVRGLAVLAAGARYAKRLDIPRYLEQRRASEGFWAGVVELGMSHPYLPKRMGAILADTRPEMEVPAVQRNPLAYVAAPFFGAGAAGAVAMSLVMMVGIGAAIAVPSVLRYKEASAAAAAQAAEPEQAPAAAEEAPSEIDRALEERLREELRVQELEAKAAEAARQAEREIGEAADQELRRWEAPAKKKSAKRARSPNPKPVKAPKRRAPAKAAASDDVLY